MATHRRSPTLRLFDLGLRSLLLLILALQAILLSCELFYGHIPLPAKKINRLLAKHSLDGLHIEANAYLLRLDGQVEAFGLKVFRADSSKPLLQAGSAMLRWSFRVKGNPGLQIHECVLSNGTLYLPAVYSPDGRHMALLSGVAIDLELKENRIRANSICARLDDWILRGTAGFSLPDTATSGKSDPVDSFHKLASQILAFKMQHDTIQKPTIAFDLLADESGRVDVDLLLSLRSVENGIGQANRVSLHLDAELEDGELQLKEPGLLTCGQLEVATPALRALDANCRIAPQEFDKLIQMRIPQMDFSAREIRHADYAIGQPYFRLAETTPGQLHLAGSASIKGQVSALSADYHLDGKRGTLEARGTLTPDSVIDALPAAIRKELPHLDFTERLRYAASINFEKATGLKEARFDLEARRMVVGDLSLDLVRARCRHNDTTTRIDDLLVYRDDQYAEAVMQIDTREGKVTVQAKGDIQPKQYSRILPSWWGDIFNDFTIHPNSPVLADFAVQSDYRREAGTRFFGEVELADVVYSGVPLSKARVVVDGTPLHIGLDISDVESSEGDFRGRIDLTRRQDGIPSLVALHLEVETGLSIDATRNLVGPLLYDRTVSDFSFSGRPRVQLTGSSYFTGNYPEYQGKSHFTFSADSNGPLQYNGAPLQYLRLRGYSDDFVTQFRDVAFGYADGTGSGIMDIKSRPGEAGTACFKFSLENANDRKAIEDLPALDRLEDDFQRSREADDQTEAAGQGGSLDASLHALGPLDDPYRFTGQGNFIIRDKQLGTIQLLGPLSMLLQGTALGFTSFELNQMTGDFWLEDGQARFLTLQVDGPITRIDATGSMELESQALDMRVAVHLFGNAAGRDNPIHRIGDRINPLSALLRFELRGTLEKQRWRSIFDPRKLIPGF